MVCRGLHAPTVMCTVVYITAPLCAGSIAGAGGSIFSNLVVSFRAAPAAIPWWEEELGIPRTWRSLGEVRAQAEPGHEENHGLSRGWDLYQTGASCIKVATNVSFVTFVHI